MRCSRCRDKLECANNTSCWCSEYPVLNIQDKEASCMCRSCMIQALSKQYNTNKYISDDDKKKIAGLGVPKTPIEGVDFHINVQGLYTFTSWYLLRRGYCCENDCQNCPYK